MPNSDRSDGWHALSAEEVIERLDAQAEGMSTDQARRRLDQAGPNSLEAQEGVGPIRMLLRQINNPLIWLLIGAVILSVVVGEYIDAGVIAFVVVLNTILGFFQEYRAEKSLEALREMSSPNARVLRDGDVQEVQAADVVPGDILLFDTGDRIAADARLLQAEDLEIDESALTGESRPVGKGTQPLDQDTPLAERTNMVWMSTAATAGHGRAVVVATGMDTQIGEIAGEVQSAQREQTPLQKRLGKLSVIIGITGVVLAAAVFGLGVLRGYDWLDMALFAVAAAVAAIPEGLPAVTSVTLALGVQRMARRNAIIRRLPAVETLGSTTVVCSDKTGTITANQMTVRRLWIPDRFFEVTGEGYAPEGEIAAAEQGPTEELPDTLRRLLEIGVLASNADVDQEDSQWIAEGDPSEAALIVAAGKAGIVRDELQSRNPRRDEIPFSSDYKYMATLHAPKSTDHTLACVKGAPERILGFCSRAIRDGGPAEMDDQIRDHIRRISEQLASEAFRVLAAAYRQLPADKNEITAQDVESDLTFVGLWAMIDPAREESAQAVADAKQAGMRPIMLTGDHATTAVAIARQVGITDASEAILGPDTENMDPSELARRAMDVGVFARVSPQHKLTILNALKDAGHIVAMTGDGVNDAPALKNADIGVAMGRGGTDVAREAADMILTDDNFATIIHAVEEGRRIYANLQRVIFFLLATSTGEVIMLIVALLIGLELPLTAVMILWINLVAEGACTIPIGLEPAHGDVLRQPPRDPDEGILNRTMLARIAMLMPIMAVGTLGLFWYYQQSESADLTKSRTIAFATLAAFQWFQAFNARSRYESVFKVGVFSNRWLLIGIGTAIALQLAVIYIPWAHRIFSTTALGWFDWLLVIFVSSTILIVEEILKLFHVHGRPPQSHRPDRQE